MNGDVLSGVRVVILEDEFLIALDVEQLCRDHGAGEVRILRNIAETDAVGFEAFDIAIIDVMVGGQSALDFARRLRAGGMPFIFASGYGGRDGVFDDFPDVPVVGKPYASSELIGAVLGAMAARGAA